MKKAILILLIIAIFLGGYYAVEQYSFHRYIQKSGGSSMNIPVNSNAPVFSKNIIEINAPVEHVWAILTDIQNWTRWQKSVTETRMHGAIIEGTRFDWKAGGLTFHSQIHTCSPYHFFGWTGTTFGANAIHNWTFEQNGNKTIVKVEESLQGIFPQLFKKYFQKNLDSGVLTNLTELKDAAEASLK